MQLEGMGPKSAPSQAPAALTQERGNPKLERCAHEFEASLMAELLKPLEESDGLTGEPSEDAAGSNGALAGFASESLARAISERGGFGIADRILGQLEDPGRAETKASGLKFSAVPPI
jgi:Rod binding domain-containing protein